MRGDASTGHPMSSFFHQYVKHRGKVGNDSPNAGLNPFVWAPSVCLNVLVIWNDLPLNTQCVRYKSRSPPV